MTIEREPSGFPLPIPLAWTLALDDLLARLGVAAASGLAADEVAARAARYGNNALSTAPAASAWRILARQFKGLVTYLLGAAAVAGFVYGEVEEGIAILVVILLNAGIGFATELQAVRSMEALRRLGATLCRVRRDGRVAELPAELLVPGDIVLVAAGDIVPADLRLLAASRLQAAEAALTGESVPVDKEVAALAAAVPLAERTNLLYRGTAVVRGTGEAVVVATGMATEVGRIASLVAATEREETPLEARLDRLGRTLAGVALAIAALTAAAGILAGRGVFLMIETGIALAVAAIPEGLPIVATLALARGVYRMAGNNALVNRLAAVETLGSVTVLCTDKTGTLTENRLTLARLAIDSGETDLLPVAGSFAERALAASLEIGALCANAELPAPASAAQPAGEGVGDPLELALLAAARQRGVERADLLARQPEVREVAFDSGSKRMATVHRWEPPEDGFRVAVKGAPEEVLRACSAVLTANGVRPLTDEDRKRWKAANDGLGARGFRVIALAEKTVASAETPAYADLTLVALAAVADPPRQGVAAAVASCRAAGIQAVLVTGDQEPTARAVAHAVGLLDEGESGAVSGRDLEPGVPTDPGERRRLLTTRLFTRFDPEQKLDLIALHQAAGGIVAMTGDGVNDAPALRRADIGVAMGERGSQVAREAADIVLKDDSFATIVFAVRQGRVIFENIRRFVLYLLGCNLSEILVVAVAGLVTPPSAPLPLLPLQLLFLNLVTDVFPALALGLGEGDAGIMNRPPRDPEESLVTPRHWRQVIGDGLLLAAAVWGALWLALGPLALGRERAVTISFLTLAAAQLLHVFNLRQRGSRLWVNDVTRNPYIWGALALCASLLVLAVDVPPVASVLHLVDPGAAGWGLVVGMSLVPLVVGQGVRAVLWRRAP